MWHNTAKLLIRKKYYFLVVIGLLTVWFGYKATQTELSYELAKVLPANDSTFIDYLQFRSRFGDDSNVMVIGLQDDSLFTPKPFEAWINFEQQIKAIKGIKRVLSISSLYDLKRNDELLKIEALPFEIQNLKSKSQLDSLKRSIDNLPFYDGLVYNKTTNAYIMAISFDADAINSGERISIVEDIKTQASQFSNTTNTKLHFSGMPYIRTELMKIISQEMKLFILLAFLITAFILFIFFRSFSLVFYSMIIVLLEVIWSVGVMVCLGYKISILSGLIPPLIIVIGIPNSIFLINSYQTHYHTLKNKGVALIRMLQKTGLSLLLANVTTAIGFGVFYFTNSNMLVEFGVSAAINVMLTYFLTLILITITLSLLPPPSGKRAQRIEAKRTQRILEYIDYLVHNRRRTIYFTVALLTFISLIGFTKINFRGFVVDDLPKNHPIYSDLEFFETHFNGILPFEISIDTKIENGVYTNSGRVFNKIHLLQKTLAQYPELSRPISMVEGLKFANQAYHDGQRKFYALPSLAQLRQLSPYLVGDSLKHNMLSAFVDSSKQCTRVSYQIADIGTVRMAALVKDISPKIDSIFNPKEYTVNMTGHCLVFLKNNSYLLGNLVESLILEIILIALLGMILFKSWRIIVLSKLPCIIPLIITAGIMGFVGIDFKATTLLIFTIAFGVASDGTIYFLTKYRHELRNNNRSVPDAISTTIKETGVSMIYTALILFFGFGIFAVSSFGGSKALGVLVSITLLVSMLTNLILLPALLMSLQTYLDRKEIVKPALVDAEEYEQLTS